MSKGVCVNHQFDAILSYAKSNNLTWNQACDFHETEIIKIDTNGENNIGEQGNEIPTGE